MKNNTHMGVKNILFIEFLNNKQQEIFGGEGGTCVRFLTSQFNN
jgi:hypothetical protein